MAKKNETKQDEAADKKSAPEAKPEQKPAPEQKPEAPAPEQKQDEAGEEDPAANPEHSDEQADIELFKKLIQQYLGDDYKDNQEAEEYAKHAYQSCMSKGMKQDEAFESAGKHVQMAVEIAKSMAAKQGESEDEGKAPFPKAPAKKEDETECKQDETEKKESVAKLKGENATLRESLKKYELASYLDKKLQESKEPRSVTDKFRAALGTPKSKGQIDEYLKLFMEGASLGRVKADESDSPFVMVEKNAPRTEGTENPFGACVE